MEVGGWGVGSGLLQGSSAVRDDSCVACDHAGVVALGPQACGSRSMGFRCDEDTVGLAMVQINSGPVHWSASFLSVCALRG